MPDALQGELFNGTILHVRTYTIFHHTNPRTFSACSIPVTDSTQRRRPLIAMDEKYQRREGMMSLKRPTLAVEAMLDF
jgi:hypothetical protein